MRHLLLFVLLFGCGWTLRAAEQDNGNTPVRIAAASDLIFCLERLGEAFQKDHPQAALLVTPGSSGNLFAQIRQGAPFDLFLSADRQYPLALIAAGVADSNSLTAYARGRLVLWTTRTNVEVSRGLGSLVDPSIRRIAIANPDHAPYGRIAREALERAGVWARVTNRLVLSENIAQAAQWVQTGTVDAGLVALSLVKAPKLDGVGRWWLLPPESHTPLEQAGVLTRTGSKNEMARDYLRFLQSPEARGILEQYGFQRPGDTAGAP